MASPHIGFFRVRKNFNLRFSQFTAIDNGLQRGALSQLQRLFEDDFADGVFFSARHRHFQKRGPRHHNAFHHLMIRQPRWAVTINKAFETRDGFLVINSQSTTDQRMSRVMSRMGGSRFVGAPESSSLERIRRQQNRRSRLAGMHRRKINLRPLHIQPRDGRQQRCLVVDVLIQTAQQSIGWPLPVGGGHASQHGLRAEFQNDVAAEFLQLVDAVGKGHGLTNVSGPVGRIRDGIRWQNLCADVANDGNAGRAEFDRLCEFTKRFQCRIHQRRMKRVRSCQSPGSNVLVGKLLFQCFDRGHCSAKHDVSAIVGSDAKSVLRFCSTVVPTVFCCFAPVRANPLSGDR